MASRSKKPEPAKPSRKNAKPSPKNAKPSPKNGTPPPKKKRSRLRKVITALILGLVVPAALLGLLEGSLRVLGYGYSTSFFIKNGDFLESNARFGWRFFPRELNRSIGAIWMRQKKPSGVYRIFVLGGSAAQGVPEAAFGFSRVLEVMLGDQFPGVRFEIINTAMTAVNSHVVLQIARDCAEFDPDLFVVYMGNNEVVGPFGAGTILTGFSPNLSAIRASLWVKSTRIGQLVGSIAGALGGGGERPAEWRGMEMFMDSQVDPDAPRLATMYDHFRRNLQDICAAGRDGGAKVMLSTVGVNLRHCAPFASAHRAGMSPEQLAQWEAVYRQGVDRDQAGQHAQAVDHYLAAEKIDDRYADLHFRLARCYVAMGRPDEAERHFAQARQLDALRFRADESINNIIREVAAEQRDAGVLLVDAERAFAEAPTTVARSPGEEFFHEHVHMNFRGNYELARVVFNRLVPDLPQSVRRYGPADPVALSLEQCADRLALTNLDRQRILMYMWDLTKPPPFTSQLNYAEMRRRLLDRRRQLRRDRQPMAAAVSQYEYALRLAPKDPWLHYNMACLQGARKDYAAAMIHWRAMYDQIPNEPKAQLGLGRTLMGQGKIAEAEGHFRTYIELLEHEMSAYGNVSEIFSEKAREYRQQNRPLEEREMFNKAEAYCRQLISRRPNSAPALNLLAATLIQRQDLRSAHEVLSEALKVDEGYALAHYNLGVVLIASGRPREGIEHLTRAIELDPNSEKAHFRLGQMQMNTAPDAGLGHLSRAVELAPDNVDYLSACAGILQKMGDTPGAVRYYREALSIRPGYGPVAEPLAWVLATSGDAKIRNASEAVALATSAVRQSKGQRVESLVTLAAAYAADGQFDKAIDTAGQAESLAKRLGNARLEQEIAGHLEQYRRRKPLAELDAAEPR